MGMFDKPQYLTSQKDGEGFVQNGDTFFLHNARPDGTVKISGDEREQAKLLVSRELESEKVAVWTAGRAIVNQIKRMSAEDREGFPMQVRLDQVPSKQGNPTNVLTPADQPPPGDFAPTTTEAGF